MSLKMAECVLKISTGFIKGIERTTVFNSKKYVAFQGIPYAEPPVGPNRFRDPVPCKPWSGVRDTLTHGNVCPQHSEFTKELIGNEDCLSLNVYTPQVPTESKVGANKCKWPVMVYIHGGGFTFGSGDNKIYGPDYLVEYDIILVTINYRVGVFGFLSFGNDDVPGNAGLKDQSLALKWVRDNIDYFGGDCKNVTLFGESAGAASVHYHTLSPLSSGLFHKVILQSGSAFNPWAFTSNPVSRAFRLGEVLGKQTNDVKELAHFLRSQSFESLVNNQFKILSAFERTKLVFPFTPCLEVAGTGDNFLTQCPQTLVKEGKFAKVPYIIGLNSKEGLIMLKESSDLAKKLVRLETEHIRFVPIDMCNENVLNENVFKQVKHFYFNNNPLTAENISEFCDVSADIDFLIGHIKTLKYLSLTPEIPVYVYLFSFDGDLGYLKSFIKTFIDKLPSGVCHADELGYIFHNSLVCEEMIVEKASTEVKIIDTFCTLWTNFAKTSDPNDKKFNNTWKKYKKGLPNYLDIGEPLKVVDTELFPRRAEFWNNMYESEKLTNKL